jgi:hypothetical protein
MTTMGNQQTTLAEPVSSSEVKKSALRRSCSISDTKVHNAPTHDEVRHIRHSTYDDHSSFPRTTPYDGSDINSGAYGTDSPQWGWYTHHSTPPTPEYYLSRPSKKHGGSSNSKISSQKTSTTHGSDMSSSTTETPVPVAPQPNPVFRILQNKYKANPNAWNVPC